MSVLLPLKIHIMRIRFDGGTAGGAIRACLESLSTVARADCWFPLSHSLRFQTGNASPSTSTVISRTSWVSKVFRTVRMTLAAKAVDNIFCHSAAPHHQAHQIPEANTGIGC